MTSAVEILPYSAAHREAVFALSLAAWAPVFSKMQPEVPDYVFDAFYPDGWPTRQLNDIETFLTNEADRAWVAMENGDVVGWIGGRIHEEDKMGEIYTRSRSRRSTQRRGWQNDAVFI